MSNDGDSFDFDSIDPSVRALLPNYVRRRSADVVTMRTLLETENFNELGRLAHNMRGSGGAYGLPKITEIGTSLENAAHERDAAGASVLVDELEKFVTDLKLSSPGIAT